MKTARLEAFSDGVIAIIITIMVLELRSPHGERLADLKPLLPVFLSYVLSFIYVAIYWNNHHHMIHVTRKVTGGIMWANLHLLFWLSLTPFVTAWMGENHFAPQPTALYGFVLFMSAVSYSILQKAILVSEGAGSVLAMAVKDDRKEKISTALYGLAIPAAFVNRWLAGAVFVAIAMMWFVPDRRIEKAIAAHLQKP